jgi:hypothetical protein
MRIGPRFILALVLFVLVHSVCFAQEDIEIRIDGEVYSMEYPKTYEEATSVINSIVSIYNELDDTFMEYRSVTDKNEAKLIEKITILERNIIKQEEIISSIEKSMKAIHSELMAARQKRDLMLNFSLGPTYNLKEIAIGTSFGMGLFKNLKVVNLYAGLNLNTTIYYHLERNVLEDIGISLYLGMFLK